jgi:hypothetical protein
MFVHVHFKLGFSNQIVTIFQLGCISHVNYHDGCLIRSMNYNTSLRIFIHIALSECIINLRLAPSDIIFYYLTLCRFKKNPNTYAHIGYCICGIKMKNKNKKLPHCWYRFEQSHRKQYPFILLMTIIMHFGKRINVDAIQINVSYLFLDQHARVWCGCLDALYHRLFT